jgi:hypothetical protein
MPIGYGSIGESSIGELIDAGPVTITLPVPPAIALAAVVATITAGVSILTSPAVIALSAPELAIQAGSNQVLPVPAIIGLTTQEPAISGGGYVVAPAPLIISLASPALLTQVGVNVANPAPPIISLTSPELQALQSANVLCPAPLIIGVTSPLLNADTGLNIYLDTALTIVEYGGGISEGSIGEFSIGEGPPTVRVIRGPPRIVVQSRDGLVQVGASVLTSPSVIHLTSPILEIDSRSRRLRTLVIAS